MRCFGRMPVVRLCGNEARVPGRVNRTDKGVSLVTVMPCQLANRGDFTSGF